VLRDQAALVIANQRQAQARLDKAVSAYEKAQASAGQALLLAEQETHRGNAEKALNFGAAAESFAERLLTLETEIVELERALLNAATAADQAKAQVAENAQRLVQQMQRKEALLDELDRTAMQETLNKATASLGTTIGEDVPTFDEVSRKIHARTHRAEGQAELQAALASTSVDTRMLEVEQAQRSAAAQARLTEMRLQLGLPVAAPAGELLPPTPQLRVADDADERP
jgi:phage shock protein A